MEIGARLKEAREAKGMSLGDVQNETKIQSRYIQAIENGDFGIMPGKFYTRAFIRQYAEAVGLDPEVVMEEHANELPSSSEEEYIQYTRLQRSKDEASSKGTAIFTFLPKFIIGLLVIGILVIGYIFYQKTIDTNPDDNPTQDEGSPGDEVFRDEDNDSAGSGDNDDTSTDNEAGNTEEDEGEQENQQAEEPTEPQVEYTVTEKASSPEGVSNMELTYTDELVFTFTYNENGRESWLSIQNGKGKSFIDRLTTASEDPELTFDLTGEQRLRIRVARPEQVDITVNGEPFEYPVEPTSTVQTFWIDLQKKNQ